MTLEIMLLLFLGFLVCLVLGANNASAWIGTNVGAGFVRYPVAAGLAAVGVLLGVALEGAKLSKAVSEVILTEITLEIGAAIIITGLIVMAAATLFHLPLSLSESLIGATVGIGMGSGVGVNWSFASLIFAFWIITPFFAAILSVIIQNVITRVSHAVKNLLTLNYLYSNIASIFSFYIAYVSGASAVGLINGIYIPFMENLWISAVVFGIATALGIYSLGRGVTESIGTKIIGLSPSSALVTQLSGALIVHFFIQFGLPVSITHAIVGGIFGIGLAKRTVIMNKRLIRNIIAGWIFAPIIGAAVSFIIVRLI